MQMNYVLSCAVSNFNLVALSHGNLIGEEIQTLCSFVIDEIAHREARIYLIMASTF